MAEITIDIKPVKVGNDPSITIFHVTIRSERGIWTESWGSRELLEAFLQGVKAALSFTEVGHIEIPPIPEVRI